MRGFVEYTAACLISIALVGVIAWAVSSPAGKQAVMVSAGIVFAIQLLSFGVARLLRSRHLMLGWGLGSVVRLVALVVYGLVVAKAWRVPAAPALLSFAAFLFVTTVFEPVFLKR
ncbi:MAG TPA: hypothetical protein VFT29_03010 [Gemmatimonadaceae bacterium]|nr:hypothetical protein [Gemmatimonadaceae bacterium]